METAIVASMIATFALLLLFHLYLKFRKKSKHNVTIPRRKTPPINSAELFMDLELSPERKKTIKVLTSPKRVSKRKKRNVNYKK